MEGLIDLLLSMDILVEVGTEQRERRRRQDGGILSIGVMLVVGLLGLVQAVVPNF